MSDTAEPEKKPEVKVWYKRRTCIILLIFILVAISVAAIVVGLLEANVFSSDSKNDDPKEGSLGGISGMDSSAPTEVLSTDTVKEAEPSERDEGNETSIPEESRFIDGYLPPPKYTEKQVMEMKPEWELLAAMVIPWSEWSAMCGDGVCGEGEWCRNCPADCPCTFNCGNGVCEDGEDMWKCPSDCVKITATCGNGKCEMDGDFPNSTNYRIGFENKYICPIDCPLSDDCGDGTCDKTESCWTCPKDCGKCEDVCGDSKCDTNESCDTCPRDCGKCAVVHGDNICAWPRETFLDSPEDCKAFIESGFKYAEFEGIRYATLRGADPNQMIFTDSNCFYEETKIPNGWKLATVNDRSTRLLKEFYFETGCLIMEGGVSKSSGGAHDEYCFASPLQITEHGNGSVSVGFHSDQCPSRILLEAIEDVMSADDFVPKKCPYDCWGNGACDSLSGKCSCHERWTGSYCERVIGDFRVPEHRKDWYKPEAGISWQWQLQDAIDQSFDVDLYDVDVDTSPKVIQELHDAGRKVMCYFSAGSWEEFRRDEAMLAKSIRGGPLDFGDGDVFTDEAWLDLRRMDMFLEVMLQRIDYAREQGCDAIEYDNLDMIIHEHNIPNAEFDLGIQLMFNKWLAHQAHARGMGVALKNSNEFNMFLSETFDMVVNEECWINGNCEHYWPFLQRNKPILNCEYFTSLCMYCDRSTKMNFSTIKKNPPLDACRADCQQSYSHAPCESIDFPDSNGSYQYAKYPQLTNGWCPMTKNTDEKECSFPRFRTCDSQIGY